MSDVPEPGDTKHAEEKEYRRAMERSMTSIEDHVADIAASLEKLRATQHNLVAKTLVLDDISSQLDVVSAMASVQRDLVSAVGRMSDKLEEISRKWEDESSDMRRRLGRLEADGKRIE